MLDTYVTVVGNLVADPRLIETDGRAPMVSFRVASTPRRFDRRSGEWRDGETLFTNVTCWRGLAENVMLSLKKGNSVIVHGRLTKRGYETKAGEHRESVDIDALAVGPELSRVATVIKRVERSATSTPWEAATAEGPTAGEPATAAGPDEFDTAMPAVEGGPELDGVDEDLDDGDVADGGDDLGDLGDLGGAEAEAEPADEPEMAGAGAASGGRLRSRFGIG